MAEQTSCFETLLAVLEVGLYIMALILRPIDARMFAVHLEYLGTNNFSATVTDKLKIRGGQWCLMAPLLIC